MLNNSSRQAVTINQEMDQSYLMTYVFTFIIQRDSSPSKDPSTTRSSSGYNRSLSDTHHSRQYGGGPDPRRLSSSVDYSSHLLSGSSDRLEDNSGGLYAERRESNSSRHSKSSSKRHSIAGEINHNNNNTMSGSNSNIYQVRQLTLNVVNFEQFG